MVSAVKDITRKYNKPDFRIALGGTPVMTDTLKRSMISDMLRFVLLIITAIIVTMGIMFRRREGIMLPMIIVVFSVISTIALMHLLGFTLHLPTMILPSFLLAVGIADAIHILAIFFYRYDHGDSKENAIIYTISHSGLAVLMTSITTAAGLMSFSGSDIAPIAALGLFSGLGVSLAFIYTIIVIPALVSILPIKRKKTAIGRPGHKMDAVLNFFAGFSVKHAGKITVIFMLLLFTSAFFSFRLKFSHDPMMWLPENSDLIKSTRLIDKHLKGASVLEVIIDGGHENSCYNPALLKQIEKTRAKVEAYSNHHISIAKTFTLTDMLKEIHKALNSGSNKYYKIPDKRRIIAQEFLLFENSGSDDLREMVDSGFQQTRFSIKLPWADALLYAAMLKDMEKMFEKDFKDMADTKLTGLVHMLGRTINIAIKGAASSYLIALAVITLLMILLIGKLRIGLLSMFPNLFPIFFSLGLMQLLAIPLDLFTMLIANIAIGLAVDDTIHFMHNWHRYYEEKQDPGAAVRSTLLTAGRAMFTTSVVLIAGFVIFTGGNMRNLQRFGFLSALTISLALLADFLLAPALMTLVHKKISIRSK
ncbi:MAG TPA: efflux RND transporter permease subunit, partial [Spirochaetota bacterium]|nr:efflux RND transporter permease subunit [Spirochaetota bacterium]